MAGRAPSPARDAVARRPQIRRRRRALQRAITKRLLDGALHALDASGVARAISRCTGCPALSSCRRRRCTWRARARFAAIVCVGCVIRGQTPHFDFVAGQAAAGIQRVGLETGVPTTFGVVTALTEAQAWERAGGRGRQPRRRGGQAALEMVEFSTVLRRPPRAAEPCEAAPAANKMGKRRKAREVALQFLYQLDQTGADDPTPFEDDFWSRHPVDEGARAFAASLVRGAKGAAGQDRRDHRRDRGALGSRAHGRGRPQYIEDGRLRACCASPPCGQGRDQRGHRDRQEVRHGPSRAASSTACSTVSTGSCDPPEHAPPVRYAILSDVHGNLEALRAVLADAVPRTDGVLCLGDSVGYGADPGACVELLDARARAIVAGNHEHGVAGLLDLDWFNRWARAAAEWTRERLDDDQRTWLGGAAAHEGRGGRHARARLPRGAPTSGSTS